MVMIIISISVVAVGLVLVFTLALAVSARSGDNRLWEDGPLSLLGAIRSPSGRPFFASRNAMRDFLETMEDLGRDLRSAGRSGTVEQPQSPKRAVEDGSAARELVADTNADGAQRPR
jgi:hypothetical protein